MQTSRNTKKWKRNPLRHEKVQRYQTWDFLFCLWLHLSWVWVYMWLRNKWCVVCYFEKKSLWLYQHWYRWVRKTHKITHFSEIRDPLEDRRKHDEKLLLELSDVISDYSQQRMRALHMSLRLYGNDENRISNKDLMQSLQVSIITSELCWKS